MKKDNWKTLPFLMTCTILLEWYIRREGKMAANDENCWWVHRLFPGHKLYLKESYFWENHLSTEKNHEGRQKISLRSDAPWLYLYSMHGTIQGVSTFILITVQWQPKKSRWVLKTENGVQYVYYGMLERKFLNEWKKAIFREGNKVFLSWRKTWISDEKVLWWSNQN